MNHLVLIDFVDKESGVYNASGSFYTSTNFERVIELEKLGFIKANEEASSLKTTEKKQPVKRTRKKASDADARKG